MTTKSAQAGVEASNQTGPSPTSSNRLRSSGSLRLLAVLAMAWLPAVLGTGVVGRVTGLHPGELSTVSYWVPDHAVLLYVVLPLVVGSAFLLCLSPGILLALAWGRFRNGGELLLQGFAISLPILVVGAPLAAGVVPGAAEGQGFAVFLVLVSLLAFGVLRGRVRRGGGIALQGSLRSLTADVVAALGPALLVLVILLPKFFWESFNGDGVHTYETVRRLLRHSTPFWPAGSGAMESWPGISSVLFFYPASWFMRLFGEFDVVVRFPFCLYLSLLYAAIAGLARSRGREAIRWIEGLLIWGALGTYTLMVAYSASYEMYSADIALPAAQDTLLLAVFTGGVLFFGRRRWGWAAGFFTLTAFTSPGGVLLLALWGGAVLMSWRPVPWRGLLAVASSLAAFALVSNALPPALRAVGLPDPGGEHGITALLSRFELLQFTDWTRLLWVLLPAGIVPVVTAVRPPRDRVARALVLAAAGSFALFYVQAHVALHHFVPAVVLFVAAFWCRRDESPFRSRGMRIAVAAGLAISMVLVLPRTFRVSTEARAVGRTVYDGTSGYAELRPRAFRRAQVLLGELFPRPADPRLPDESFGGSPLVWHRYARRSSEARNAAAYLMLDRDDRPPTDAVPIARREGAVLYVRDFGTWHAHRRLRPPAPVWSPVLTVSRGTMFRGFQHSDGPRIFDVRRLVSRITEELR